MTRIKQAIVVLGALALSGCAVISQIFVTGKPVDVAPVGYALDCGSQRPETTVRTLVNADELQKWQMSRGLTLLRADAPQDGPYALVELGQRATGGYGLVVSRDADIRKNVLFLHVTFITPNGDHPGTPQPTSPCVLISMPPGFYQGVSVVDQSGKVVATSSPGA